MIKKCFFTILSVLILTISVNAKTLKIIIPSGADGSFNTRFQVIKDALEKTWGDDLQFVYGDNCARGKTLVEKEKGPMLTLWDANFNMTEECRFRITKKNVIAVESNYMRLCAAPGSKITRIDVTRRGVDYKVGHSTPHTAYQKWFAAYNDATGTKLSPVPYSSSGSARRGILAGDIDLVFISPSNSNKLMKAGGQCFYSTAPSGEEKHQIPALVGVASFEKATINQAYFYGAKNLSRKEIRSLQELFNDIASGRISQYTEFAGTKDIYLVGTTSQMKPKDMVDFVDNTTRNWK